jgi:uncharacterized delta-60 repeat protein
MKTSTAVPPNVFESLEGRRMLSAGQLDPTFGNGGKVVTDAGLGFGNGVAIQADGKIVAVATDDDSRGFHLLRYNPDGSLDRTFGTGGLVDGRFGGDDSDNVEAMIVQPDGKILLGSRAIVERKSTMVVYTVLTRYNANGTVDKTFGDNGVLRLPGDTYRTDVWVQATFSPGKVVLASQVDGKIVLTQVRGDDGTTSGADLVVMRLTSAGKLDNTFGDHGKTVVDVGTIESPRDMAIQADGKIVLAVNGVVVLTNSSGTSWPSDKTHLIRLNPNGTLDASFGAGGIVTQNATLGQVDANKVAIGLDGKILLMAEDLSRSVSQFSLTRYEPNGTVDETFADGGRLVLDSTGGAGYADLLVQPDGKLLLTGGKNGGRNDRPGVLSMRLNQDGTPDVAYGDEGSTWVGVGDQFDAGGAATLQQDGGILIIGFMNKFGGEDSHDNHDMILIRLQGGAGSGGSRFATLRRGHDQQAPYAGRKTRKHRHKKHRTTTAATPRQAPTIVAAPAVRLSTWPFNTSLGIHDDKDDVFSGTND